MKAVRSRKQLATVKHAAETVKRGSVSTEQTSNSKLKANNNSVGYSFIMQIMTFATHDSNCIVHGRNVYKLLIYILYGYYIYIMSIIISYHHHVYNIKKYYIYI